MALFDLPLDELRAYTPERTEAADFDDFWSKTLAEAAEFDLAPEFTPADTSLTGVEVYDASFAGWGGHRINAWLLVPRGADRPLSCVVRFIGYGGGRGFAEDHTVWAAAGHAALIVDSRGQGGAAHHAPGATADPDGGAFAQAPGVMTRGVLDPETYYYRRLFTDAVRAVDTAAGHPAVDADRISVSGGSQGGAIAQAAAALHPGVRAAVIDVPFLCHMRRAVEITGKEPYAELVRFLAAHRGQEERVMRTLSYFDGMNLAARGRVPALYSVALMDEVCPPSTVFAAHNHWAGPKDITVWPWNGHEGGGGEQMRAQLRFLADLD
ncbi:cephalosporin-C deacetylase [Nocardiopsis sp. Huas11]|uniref:acetylxylan esterase n=1 Tax=Nocardiopsis sp. Huas11 TaxID=2183912 RepID=UPI000EB1C788|nr:acetylxylan esterase [Nocardiopsis sp. Huas11]RKS05304.1 cephalosporin-C deacetylase [Nocardiopsis sp. Huas11]